MPKRKRVSAIIRRLYFVALRIDNRLDGITAHLNRLSNVRLWLGLITGLLIFLLSLFGLTLTGVLGPKELSPAQKDAKATLKSLNLPATSSDAIRSLQDSDGRIDTYFSAGVEIDKVQAGRALKEQINAGKLSANAAKYIPILAASDPQFGEYLARIKSQLASLSNALRAARNGRIDGETFCSEPAFSQDDLQLFRRFIAPGKTCDDWLVQVGFLQDLYSLAQTLQGLRDYGWEVVAINDPAYLANIATLNERNVSPLSRTPLTLSEAHKNVSGRFFVARSRLRISRTPTSKTTFKIFEEPPQATPTDYQLNISLLHGGRSVMNCDDTSCETDSLILRIDGSYFLVSSYDIKGRLRRDPVQGAAGGVFPDEFAKIKCPDRIVGVPDSCVSPTLSGTPKDILHGYVQRINRHLSPKLNCIQYLNNHEVLIGGICRALDIAASSDSYEVAKYTSAFGQIEAAVSQASMMSSQNSAMGIGYAVKGLTSMFTKFDGLAVDSFEWVNYWSQDEKAEPRIISDFGLGIWQISRGKCSDARATLSRYGQAIKSGRYAAPLVVVNFDELTNKCL